MIRSTFSSLMTARSGIVAGQLGLTITGQNMSNVNTKGYTRQRIDQISFGTTRNSYRLGIGQGVLVTGTSQLRSSALDNRFRNEYGSLGELDTQYSILSQLESILSEFKTSSNGLTDQFSEFLAALTALQKNNGGDDHEALLQQACNQIANLLNSYATEIDNLRNQVEEELETVEVTRVNQILEQLAELNKAIYKQEVSGQSYLELEDARNLLLDELSGYMDIEVNYTPSAQNPKGHDVEIYVKGADGNKYLLVENDEYGSVSYDSSTGVFEVTDTSGTDTPFTDNFSKGIFKGLLDMLNKSGEFDSPASDVRGIGYYEGLLDVLADTFAQTMNGLMPAGEELFDGGPPFSASSIAVAQDWMDGAYNIDTANDNIKNFIDAYNDKSISFTTPGGTPLFEGTWQQYFGFIGTMIETETASALSKANTKAAVVNGVIDMRDSISSVSLDEEAMNMIMYQKAYNASSRMMTTLDQALDTLINNTGIVGR